MKSARIEAFTQRPEDIRIVDVPIPEPGPGQVRVRMIASPVHPSDFHFVQGIYYKALQRVIWNHPGVSTDGRVYFDPERREECLAPPYALGREGVGIVEASGGGILARRLVGRRVVVGGGPPNGVWQEHVAIAARRVMPVPAHLADEQAAMYLANPFSACVLVREILKVPRDAWLLVTAAGSALGKSVARMGRRDGFRTICVVRSSAGSAELMKLGADVVIETDRHDLIAEVARLTAGQGVRYALDCVGGKLASDVVRCLGLDGRLVLYGTMAESPVELQPRDLMMPMTRIEGFYVGNWIARQSPLKLLGVLRTVKRLTAEGLFETEVSETYPLDRVAAAVAASLQAGRTGKVMLRIG